MSSIVDLVVVVDGVDVDDAERAELARQLRAELRDSDVDSVEPASAGHLPRSAKSGEAIAFGALAVALAPEVYKQVVGVVTAWLGRQRPGIKVEIDGQVLEGRVSREQGDAIVAAYLKRIGAEENR
jgi:hypothetical protein